MVPLPPPPPPLLLLVRGKRSRLSRRHYKAAFLPSLHPTHRYPPPPPPLTAPGEGKEGRKEGKERERGRKEGGEHGAASFSSRCRLGSFSAPPREPGQDPLLLLPPPPSWGECCLSSAEDQ
ncbi:Hypothetical predicted protein [Podarcis lilfordi]|uniref:Uncharacterized protein n=1 Tax=Podarcis lilfordi TaxID=74358 RepID=A0AA35PCJ0_9SAUR|nr:Hypothetical predicted protein [Podarcis lilfordi]